MDIATLRQKYKTQILEIAEICNAENVRIFGSRARGDAREDSDIDFLVHMKPNAGLGFLELHWRLEELLNMKVDVVSDKHLNHIIKDRVLEEAVSL